jgi:hypothetical protein
MALQEMWQVLGVHIAMGATVATASNPHEADITWRQDSPAHYRWMWTFVHLIRWQRDAERATVPQ